MSNIEWTLLRDCAKVYFRSRVLCVFSSGDSYPMFLHALPTLWKLKIFLINAAFIWLSYRSICLQWGCTWSTQKVENYLDSQRKVKAKTTDHLLWWIAKKCKFLKKIIWNPSAKWHDVVDRRRRRTGFSSIDMALWMRLSTMMFIGTALLSSSFTLRSSLLASQSNGDESTCRESDIVRRNDRCSWNLKWKIKMDLSCLIHKLTNFSRRILNEYYVSDPYIYIDWLAHIKSRTPQCTPSPIQFWPILSHMQT